MKMCDGVLGNNTLSIELETPDITPLENPRAHSTSWTRVVQDELDFSLSGLAAGLSFSLQHNRDNMNTDQLCST